MTLQIAWSGMVAVAANPDIVPRFPTLHEERFMAYQAIVNGARGLMFFGGHLTQVARPGDAQAGWNWTFWDAGAAAAARSELSSTAVAPALVAPTGAERSRRPRRTSSSSRGATARFLYVIAVATAAARPRRSASPACRAKLNGSPIAGGQVLFEYVQEPPPPPDRRRSAGVPVA